MVGSEGAGAFDRDFEATANIRIEPFKRFSQRGYWHAQGRHCNAVELFGQRGHGGGPAFADHLEDVRDNALMLGARARL